MTGRGPGRPLKQDDLIHKSEVWEAYEDAMALVDELNDAILDYRQRRIVRKLQDALRHLAEDAQHPYLREAA